MFRILRQQSIRIRAFTDIRSNRWNSVANNHNAAIDPLTRKSYSIAKPYNAAILEEFNGKLKIEKITNRTKLGQGMVRVGVKYCSLNLYDVKCMEHENDEFLLPMIPGTEFSGEVLELGPDGQQNLNVGDKVASLLSYKSLGGGLASECVVSENECFPIGLVSLKNAAVLAQGHGTALLAFTKYSELKENDCVIVIAGPGGNGLAAIQLANSVFKAKVYAICDTEDTSALIREEGAYKSISINEGFSAVYKFLAKSFTDKKATIVYDAAGGGLIHLVADFMDPNGHFFTADPFYTPEQFLQLKPEYKKPSKQQNITALSDSELVSKIQFVDITKYRLQDLELYRQTVQDTLSLCEEEIINPYVSHCFNLCNVNDAVEFIKNKKCTGKVLIDVNINETNEKDGDSDSDDESKK